MLLLGDWPEMPGDQESGRGREGNIHLIVPWEERAREGVNGRGVRGRNEAPGRGAERRYAS